MVGRMKWLRKLLGGPGESQEAAPQSEEATTVEPSAHDKDAVSDFSPKPADPVTAPDPHDAVSSGQTRASAAFVGEVRTEPPKTLGGPQLEANVRYRVRYEDGSEADWDPKLVLPVEPSDPRALRAKRLRADAVFT
jgi:hypothetical protein